MPRRTLKTSCNKITIPNLHSAPPIILVINMPSKSSSAGKGKAKSRDAGESGGGKLKAATSINVRHILVSAQRRLLATCFLS